MTIVPSYILSFIRPLWYNGFSGAVIGNSIRLEPDYVFGLKKMEHIIYFKTVDTVCRLYFHVLRIFRKSEMLSLNGKLFNVVCLLLTVQSSDNFLYSYRFYNSLYFYVYNCDLMTEIDTHALYIHFSVCYTSKFRVMSYKQRRM